MPKYRNLTPDELKSLEKDFIKYLIVNGIDAAEWAKIQDQDSTKAEEITELFSDVVFEKVLRQATYLRHQTLDSLHCFHYQEKQAVMIGLKSNNGELILDINIPTLLKSGGIDMTMYLSPQQYLDLSNDPNLGSNFSFHRVETLKIAFLSLNNRDPELQDVAVRKALSHSMNVGALLEAEENGLGTEVSILVHPSKRYYPHHLPPRKYDIDKAINLLESAGWKDTNGDGIRDKTIDGKFEELVFDFYMSGSQLTQTIALLLQQAGEKVGFELNVIQKNARAYIKDNVITHHYEIAALSDSYNEPDADPYIKWHSESTTQAGRNRSGFTTPELDSIIAIIRKENDSDKREEHFKVFCEILYDGTPVIPLFAPVNIIAVDNRYRGVCTSKRPGYMANTFTLQ